MSYVNITDRVAPAVAITAVPGGQSSAGFNLLFDTFDITGAAMPFERNAEIFGDGEPADYVYKVISGAVRTYRVLSDGRRQIDAFHLPGDMFGLELGEKHACSAEAVTSAKVLLVRRSSLLSASQRDGEVARKLWALTAQQLRRSQDHALLLIKSAQERVAAFLLEMAKRLRDASSVELPMSRQDIADYLGLTIETVSRTLTQFEDQSTIELLASRRIALRNPTALRQLNS
ncbi:MAG: helix-turn-helix domain-containing protein [Xanthobacteraceae bacterium]